MNARFFDAISKYVSECWNCEEPINLQKWIESNSIQFDDFDLNGITEVHCTQIQLGLQQYISNKKKIRSKELKQLLKNIGISELYKPDSDYTSDEHYIAQMYLKRFAKQDSDSKAFIWQYCLETMSHCPVDCAVNINNICCENDLYELKDNNNNYIDRNSIENLLSEYESVFSNLFDKIEEKARNANKTLFNCLDYQEQGLLKTYLILQIPRFPFTINQAQEILIANPALSLDSNEARNIALKYCLEAYISDTIDESNIYFRIFDWFSDKSIIIGKCDEEVIFTGDRPIYLQKDNKNGVIKVIFPISSNLILYMCPQTQQRKWNSCLMKLNNEHVEKVQLAIAFIAKKWIYSKHELSKSQISIIKEAMERKNANVSPTY